MIDYPLPIQQMPQSHGQADIQIHEMLQFDWKNVMDEGEDVHIIDDQSFKLINQALLKDQHAPLDNINASIIRYQSDRRTIFSQPILMDGLSEYHTNPDKRIHIISPEAYLTLFQELEYSGQQIKRKVVLKDGCKTIDLYPKYLTFELISAEQLSKMKRRTDNSPEYESLEFPEVQKYQFNYYPSDSASSLKQKIQQVLQQKIGLNERIRVYVLNSVLFKIYSFKRMLEYYYLKEDMNNVASKEQLKLYEIIHHKKKDRFIVQNFPGYIVRDGTLGNILKDNSHLIVEYYSKNHWVFPEQPSFSVIKICQYCRLMSQIYMKFQCEECGATQLFCSRVCHFESLMDHPCNSSKEQLQILYGKQNVEIPADQSKEPEYFQRSQTNDQRDISTSQNSKEKDKEKQKDKDKGKVMPDTKPKQKQKNKSKDEEKGKDKDNEKQREKLEDRNLLKILNNSLGKQNNNAQIDISHFLSPYKKEEKKKQKNQPPIDDFLKTLNKGTAVDNIKTTNIAPPSNFIMPNTAPIEPYKANYKKGKGGIANLTNSCYLNSSIQVLSRTVLGPLLLDLKGKVNKPVVKAYIELLGYLKEATQNIAVSDQRAKRFKDVIDKQLPLFNGYEQHDAHEFLTFFMDKVSTELNKPVKFNEENNYSIVLSKEQKASNEWFKHISFNNSAINTLFYGLQLEQTKCPNCNETNSLFAPFNTISCSIDNIAKEKIVNSKGIDLQDCLKQQLHKQTVLDQGNQWYCKTCETKRRAYRKTGLYKTGKYLLVQIKRFRRKNDGTIYQKNSTKVLAPLFLNLQGFLEDPTLPEAYYQKYQSSERVKLCLPEKLDLMSSYNYELRSIILHTGTIKAGHYKALCIQDGEWWQFDDGKTQKVEIQKLLHSSDIQEMVYIMLYEKVSRK